MVQWEIKSTIPDMYKNGSYDLMTNISHFFKAGLSEKPSFSCNWCEEYENKKMNTDNPEFYACNNGPQRQFARHVWEEFTEQIEKELGDQCFDKVLDFGCGTGDITVNLATWIQQWNERRFLTRYSGVCF